LNRYTAKLEKFEYQGTFKNDEMSGSGKFEAKDYIYEGKFENN
jgi:hypothetical protein